MLRITEKSLVLWLLLSLSVQASAQTSTERWSMAFTGSPSPVGFWQSGWQTFQEVAITSDGNVAFMGMVSPPATGIFFGPAMDLEVVATTGFLMPGLGITFPALQGVHPIANCQGAVAFANIHGVWVAEAGSLESWVADGEGISHGPPGESRSTTSVKSRFSRNSTARAWMKPTIERSTARHHRASCCL